MANEMPAPEQYTGLSRTVLQYCDRFRRILISAKEGGSIDLAPLEELVDVGTFERMGVARGPRAEIWNWSDYKDYLKEFALSAAWEGTFRRITEAPDLVILEMVERISRPGTLTEVNTVTIYKFNKAEKLVHLDVYVMPL